MYRCTEVEKCSMAKKRGRARGSQSLGEATRANLHKTSAKLLCARVRFHCAQLSTVNHDSLFITRVCIPGTRCESRVCVCQETRDLNSCRRRDTAIAACYGRRKRNRVAIGSGLRNRSCPARNGRDLRVKSSVSNHVSCSVVVATSRYIAGGNNDRKALIVRHACVIMCALTHEGQRGNFSESIFVK